MDPADIKPFEQMRSENTRMMATETRGLWRGSMGAVMAMGGKIGKYVSRGGAVGRYRMQAEG